MPTSHLTIAILHYPVYDKNGAIVTTSITPIDLHDIARAAKTYGVDACYFVTPLKSQRRLIHLIVDHWSTGYGAKYNPTRKQAMELIRVSESHDEAIETIAARAHRPLKTIATSARLRHHDICCSSLQKRMKTGEEDYLILFGTGWGLAEEIIEGADYRLEPVTGQGDYNHLSVRSAVSIILDRIMGARA